MSGGVLLFLDPMSEAQLKAFLPMLALIPLCFKSFKQLLIVLLSSSMPTWKISGSPLITSRTLRLMFLMNSWKMPPVA